MMISLYTSRVVLNTLGIDDFGIYGVVGSVVSIFGFLNATMSASTSRFLTYELGNKNKKQLKQVFNCAFVIHFAISIIIIILAETIGLWYLQNKMVLPPGRLNAALWAYQFSIIASVISITQVPFTSSVISHERMDFFAIIEIGASFLKLVIVFLLNFGRDKLILYSLLVLCVQILIASIYRIYCVRNFEECRLNGKWTKEIGGKMLTFSGWSLYSNLCFSTRQQGTNLLLNAFGGAAVNAAAGISTNIMTLVEQFSSNLLLASRPQIIKQFAEGAYSTMVNLMQQTALIANCLFIMLSLPLAAEMDYVLNLWLITPPEYLSGFCKLMLCSSFVSMNTNVLNTVIQASGRIGKISVINGTVSILVIPVVYFMFKYNGSLYYAYIVPVIFCFLIYYFSVIEVRRNIEFSPIVYWMRTFIKPILFAIPSILIITTITHYLESTFLRLLIVSIVPSLVYLFLIYIFLLPASIKAILRKRASRFLHYAISSN